MPFAALELREGETPHVLVKTIFDAAQAQRVRFAQFVLFGYLVLGSRRFIRFQYDRAGLTAVLKDMGREVILPQGEGYALQSNKASVPTLSLQSVADRQVRREYRGTAVKFWERQFLV